MAYDNGAMKSAARRRLKSTQVSGRKHDVDKTGSASSSAQRGGYGLRGARDSKARGSANDGGVTNGPALGR